LQRRLGSLADPGAIMVNSFRQVFAHFVACFPSRPCKQ
jgi:hypothetical protein